MYVIVFKLFGLEKKKKNSLRGQKPLFQYNRTKNVAEGVDTERMVIVVRDIAPNLDTHVRSLYPSTCGVQFGDCIKVHQCSVDEPEVALFVRVPPRQAWGLVRENSLEFPEHSDV